MDPLSHALTGCLLGQSVARPGELRAAGFVGALAGVAPDADVIIRSSEDALLQLEYHRHFTHALAFVPVGALICAVLGFFFLRRKLTFGRLYLFSFAGYLQGGLLDACTSYGTHLWWPFSDERVAWSNIAIIDPLYTLPLLGLAGAALWWRRRMLAWSGLAWVLIYLGLGVWQRERAEAAGAELAASRGLDPVRLEAKPSILNNILFRVIAETDDRHHVDAIRVGWFSDPIIYLGDSVPKPDAQAYFENAPPGSTLRHDLERFDVFSDRWLYFVDGDHEVIGDIRYAPLPNRINALWSLRVDRSHPDEHGQYLTHRNIDDDTLARFREMLRGVAPD